LPVGERQDSIGAVRPHGFSRLLHGQIGDVDDGSEALQHALGRRRIDQGVG
jgi:hypothetical protein